MAWTYDIAQLATSPVTQVRYRVGDVDSEAPLISDEEIAFELLDKDVMGAAIACCESIAARLLANPDYSLGPYTVKNSQKPKNFYERAAKLKQSLAANASPSYTGSRGSIFSVGMMDAIKDCRSDE